jgi:hypothetical protein
MVLIKQQGQLYLLPLLGRREAGISCNHWNEMGTGSGGTWEGGSVGGCGGDHGRKVGRQTDGNTVKQIIRNWLLLPVISGVLSTLELAGW